MREGSRSAAQNAYFDVKVSTRMRPATAPCRTIKAAYKKHEDEKRRAYGKRVRYIEQGFFTPSSSQPQVDLGKRPLKD